ncbi:DUF4270 domain-containing protein [Flavobacterium tructae]|uniref:DUF4270 domain-containing protein n=1 Tax=Flavobacterium tructae TaxID=1114873 RepID=A0A1S1JA74_9FLAO|nr:DUF4270 domain-containing protein [Flavobacterium tructae]OHT46670.1 hypothetical protein BHE19_03950 [Flavobacterium tructae]OXB20981.1 hypothetical protein B0A71_05125 [Flavobacterium tructae]
MYNTSFVKKILLVATVVLLYSCDKDFNAIGDGLIGDDHFGLESEKYEVLAYNQEVTPIQSNGSVNYGLGIYDNAVFGSSAASFVTQVSLDTYAPTIGDAPEIVSVVLSVPYFNHVKTANSDGSRTFVLDSIYGASNGKIKLGVYESGVQMRSSYFDGGAQFAQLYNTDMDTDTGVADYINFDKSKKPYVATGKPLNDDPNIAQNDEFFFNASEITDVSTDPTTGKETSTKVAPEMRLNLNKAFFLDKILKAPAAKLASADVFQEYFRGLYFKVERSGSSPANMALLNFATNGKITIKYKAKTAITTDPEDTKEDKTLTIKLTGASASLLKEAKDPAYASAITNPNKTTGDDRLYLKGGQGSLAVLELNGFGAKLDEIRTKKWLVNEANLVFSIDSDKMTGSYEPKRIYLYNLDDNVPIVDYVSDGTSSSNPLLNKAIYSGIINVDPTTKRGTTYKIRLTNHIRNMIKNATVKNVKLGLVVTGDASTIASNKLKLKNNVISEAPRASVISPLGTVLFGGTSSATIPAGKKLQLEVYYTKPN